MKAKKFIILFCIFTVIGLAGISLFNYVIDPFFRYRIKDGQYILNPRFVNPGLLKNYDYDMLLIGSSMTQLMDVPAIAEGFDANMLRISSGDMNVKEIELMCSLSRLEDVDRFIINLDMLAFNYDYEPMRYSPFLYEEDVLSDLKYLINYETSRLAPVDLFISNYIRRQEKTPSSLYNKIMIDKIGDYSDEIKVSKSAVVKDFDGHFWLNGQIVSYERMTARFDQFVANMDFGKYSDKEYIIFLPPYSVVYWHAAKERGYYDTLQRFVSYMLDNTKDYPNVRFVCMYDADFVTELDTYSDMLHYGTTRKGSITDAILGITDYNISPNNVDYRLQHLDSMLSAFEKTDWRN